MRVAFLQNVFEELTGPLILAEILERQGHEVRFFLRERGWLERIKKFSPRVLALSVCTGDHQAMLKTAARAKAAVSPPPLVIMGGPHPTFFPEIIDHPLLDAVCRGEAETAFPELLARSDGFSLPTDVENFWVKQDGLIHRNPMGPLVSNLDDIPVPSRKSLYADHPFLERSPFRKTIASRGCPFDCNYCFNHVYRKLVKGKGPYLRRRSPSHVVEEVKYLKKTFGCGYMDFNDDMFILDKAWVLEFAELYGNSLRIPFGCNIHVENLDHEIAHALAFAGCRIVKFGLENGDENFRREILNKSTTDKDIIRCADILHEHGIMFQTYNMVGLPGETLETAMATIRLNQQIKPYFAWCSLAQPLPGTRLAQICAEKRGKTHQDQMKDFPVSWFDTSIIIEKNGNQLINLQKFFAILVRFPRLEPLVRLLVRLPENSVFRILHQAVYGWHMKNLVRTSWATALQMYWKLRKQY